MRHSFTHLKLIYQIWILLQIVFCDRGFYKRTNCMKIYLLLHFSFFYTTLIVMLALSLLNNRARATRSRITSGTITQTYLLREYRCIWIARLLLIRRPEYLTSISRVGSNPHFM